MRTHNGIPCPDDAHNLPCAACNRAADHAEDREYGIEHDTGMSDLEADRFERWIARGWGEE